MTSQNTHFHRHSEGQGPEESHDTHSLRRPEAYPHSRHPEAQSAVRVLGQVDTVSGSQDPHALQAQDDNLSFSRHTRGRHQPQPGIHKQRIQLYLTNLTERKTT